MNGEKSQEMDRIIQRINAIEKERPSHKELLEFFKKIVTEQYQIKPRIKVEPIRVNIEEAAHKLKEGSPLLEKKNLKLDIDAAGDLFMKLARLVGERSEDLAKEMSKLKDALDKERFTLMELFQKVIMEDEGYLDSLVEDLNLTKGIILLLIRNSINPVFEAYAEQIKDSVRQKDWWRGYCPVCGSAPIIGALRKEEGERFLLCSCCGFEWRFKRTMCPFCGHEDNEKHRYFYLEEEGRGYRVDVCDACKTYIKTIDTRNLPEEVALFIEDLGTLHLDAIAVKEGYSRKVANILNI